MRPVQFEHELEAVDDWMFTQISRSYVNNRLWQQQATCYVILPLLLS